MDRDDWLWVGRRVAMLTVFVLGAPLTVAVLVAWLGFHPPEWLLWLIPPGF